MTSPTMVAVLAAITKLVSKCVRRINEQLLKTSGADVLSSMEILRKTSERGAPPPTRLVRPRVNTLWDLKGLCYQDVAVLGSILCLHPLPPPFFAFGCQGKQATGRSFGWFPAFQGSHGYLPAAMASGTLLTFKALVLKLIYLL